MKKKKKKSPVRAVTWEGPPGCQGVPVCFGVARPTVKGRPPARPATRFWEAHLAQARWAPLSPTPPRSAFSCFPNKPALNFLELLSS